MESNTEKAWLEAHREFKKLETELDALKDTDLVPMGKVRRLEHLRTNVKYTKWEFDEETRKRGRLPRPRE